MSQSPNATRHSQSLPHQSQLDQPVRRPNMGSWDRAASFVGGCALALYGLRRSLGHLALMAGGGALVYRALKGHCPVYQSMDIDTLESAPPMHRAEIPPGP